MPRILMWSVQIVLNHAQLDYCWWPRFKIEYVTPGMQGREAGAGAGAVKNGVAPAPKRDTIVEK